MNLACGVDPNNRAFPQATLKTNCAGNLRWAQPANLHPGSHADSHVLTLLAFLSLLASKVLVLDVIEEPGEARRVVSAVVGEPGDDVVAVFEARDHVLVAHIGGVHAELGRQLVDHTLEEERGLWPTRTAVRFNRCGVGVHTVDVLFDCGKVVHA